jgi:putative ABC transport system substrate-binding protein
MDLALLPALRTDAVKRAWSIGRIILMGLLAVGVGLANAQDARKLPRIGQVFGSNPIIAKPWDDALRQGLRDLGYVDGKNVIILPRYAHGDSARFPALLSELIALNVDVLFVAHTAVPAAMQLTKTIPIIAPTMDDPVKAGFVASVAHPSGNLTGGYVLNAETDSKRLELAMEVVPGLRRAVFLFEVSDAVDPGAANEFRTFAHGVGVTLHTVGVRNLDEIETALKAIQRNRPQALIVVSSPLTLLHRGRIIAGSASYKVPVIGQGSEFAEDGALLSYSADEHEMWKRGALYVDKILKGAKPSDLPIEQPTRFQLIINLRTAKALGITIPQSILLRADEVIR